MYTTGGKNRKHQVVVNIIQLRPSYKYKELMRLPLGCLETMLADLQRLELHDLQVEKERQVNKIMAQEPDFPVDDLQKTSTQFLLLLSRLLEKLTLQIQELRDRE